MMKYGLFFFLPLILALSCSDVIIPDISDQQVTLISPPADHHFSENEIQFNWAGLLDATFYHLEVAEPSFSNLIRFAVDTIVSRESFTTTLSDGQYQWRVTALNEAYNSLSSELRMFTIQTMDIMPPEPPFIISPEDGDTLILTSTSPDLVWQPATDAIQDSLYIYEDQNAQQLAVLLATNQTSIDLDTLSFDFSANTWFWRLRSIDTAGNLSDWSELRSFIVP